MVTELLRPVSNQKVAYETTIAGGGGSKTLFFPVDPRFKTTIQVKKNSEDATISTTSVTRLPGTAGTVDAGSAVTDLEAAEVQYSDRSTGTGDYFAGGDTGLSCVKIVSNPVTLDIVITISQYTDK